MVFSNITFVKFIFLLSAFNNCHCDAQSSSSAPTIRNSLSSSIPRTASKSQTNAGHKENLLTALAENIERQHGFKMKPPNVIKTLVINHHQRPSKFDSGDDLVTDVFSSIGDGTNFLSPKSKLGISPAASPSSSSSVRKANEGMRQIMSMHEHAIRPQSIDRSRPTGSDSDNSEASSQGNIDGGGRGKWRDIASGLVAADLMSNPNKIVAQALSYIKPLVGSKLLDHKVLGQKLSAHQNHTGPFNIKLPNLNPFSGRSNRQSSTLIESSSGSIFDGPDYRKPDSSAGSVTNSPQTSYLVKPDNESNQYASTTQSTTFFNNLKNTMLKATLIKPNNSPKDLMASESSSGLWQAFALPLSSSSNVVDSVSKLGEQQTDSSSQVKSFKPIKASSWIKNNANQMAQSYIQDSFRGILTLSQLPILSAGPVSTAPSVYEKKGNLFKRKVGSPINATNASAQDHSKRAIGELYRYAYILGTGARRKRDPLLALGSSANPLSVTYRKNHPFTQRSINQLLDTTRRLGSMLASGGGMAMNKAKPRGVMWDMATDPSLAVTVFHLLERASVALPLGEYLFM